MASRKPVDRGYRVGEGPKFVWLDLSKQIGSRVLPYQHHLANLERLCAGLHYIDSRLIFAIR